MSPTTNERRRRNGKKLASQKQLGEKGCCEGGKGEGVPKVRVAQERVHFPEAMGERQAVSGALFLYNNGPARACAAALLALLLRISSRHRNRRTAPALASHASARGARKATNICSTSLLLMLCQSHSRRLLFVRSSYRVT